MTAHDSLDAATVSAVSQVMRGLANQDTSLVESAREQLKFTTTEMRLFCIRACVVLETNKNIEPAALWWAVNG